MNAIEASLTKIDDEVARIVGKLEDVDNAYSGKTGYRHAAFDRQGARALASVLSQVSNPYSTLSAQKDEDGSQRVIATAMLDNIAARWNDRADWRQGASAANVTRAVERLVGLL